MRSIKDAFDLRFGDFAPSIGDALAGNDGLKALANRGVVRRFKPDRLPDDLLQALCAFSLSSPTKSDLQQRDILIVEDADNRARINTLLADQDWIPGAPHLLIFLGNNRRQRQIHEWRSLPFANDHLDAFFNAAVDAGIALSAFSIAAEMAGVGTCPISVIRNHAEEISAMLRLPDHVFPVAGLGVGWPLSPPFISARLPLGATVHRDRYRDTTRDVVDGYDKRRNGIFPYRAQRNVAKFGKSEAYGWSEDKARQYAEPERADFGAFVKRKGFKLE